jgi:hypothetical protein
MKKREAAQSLASRSSFIPEIIEKKPLAGGPILLHLEPSTSKSPG